MRLTNLSKLVAVGAGFLLATTLTACSSGLFRLSKANVEVSPPLPPMSAEPAPPTSISASNVTTDSGSVHAVAREPEPVAQASDSVGTERLASLAKVWSDVANYHPWAASNRASWDSAFVAAAVRTRKASSDTEFRNVVTQMLVTLNDSATKIIAVSGNEIITTREMQTAARYVTADSVLVLQLPAASLVVGGDSLLAKQLVDVEKFARVILDMRATAKVTPLEAQTVAHAIDSSGLASRFTTDALVVPTQRSRVVGPMYVDELPLQMNVGGEPFAWRYDNARTLPATAIPLLAPTVASRNRIKGAQPSSTLTRSIVIVANSNSVWPSSVLALLSASKAALFVEGVTSDALSIRTANLPVGDASILQLRLSEYTDGTRELFAADSIFEVSSVADSTAPAVQAALAAVRNNSAVRRQRLRTLNANGHGSNTDSSAYPSMGVRILGVTQLWSAMRTLHANRDAYDEDLDVQFRRALNMAESATTDTGYVRSLLFLASAGDDSGLKLEGSSLDRLIGAAVVPMAVQLIEQRAIVVRAAEELGGQQPVGAGIAVGDEIVAVDGFPITAWISEMRRTISSSNDWARDDALTALIRRGNGNALLRVRDTKGNERNVELPRTRPFYDTASLDLVAASSITGIGTDVTVVNPTVATGFNSASNPSTPATIVDLRGAVSSEGEAFVRRTFKLAEHPYARVIRRGSMMPCSTSSLKHSQSTCADSRWSNSVTVSTTKNDAAYSGLLVVLVNEHTDSRGEWLALELESAGARVAGSATRGVLGASSRLSLPGGIVATVPLEEIRRIDGGQLHRVGISPQLEFYQTVRAVRGGTDAVLDRTVQWIRQELSPPSSVRRRR